MGALDEISVAIGELRQGQESAQEERREIKRALADMRSALSANTIALAAATTAIATITPKVEATTRDRWIGYGVLLGIATIGGAVGSKMQAFLTMIGGGSHS